ncbi:MAG: glucose-6-phosphate dehydrogenase [Acidobacteriota bacterium]
MSATASIDFDMVVIGANGDLARRKLLPSLYLLDLDSVLPPGRIIGVTRHALSTEAYREEVAEHLRIHLPEGAFRDDVWQRFAERLVYAHVSAADRASYGPLESLLGERPDAERVFYLSTPPQLYGAISQAVREAGLITDSTRIVLEKPIGHDLASAQAINHAVANAFPNEDQIYRIDHYLGKETVQNLMALRFGNALFEPMWRAEHVDHVQITVAESIGIEGRGSYYDHAGALRDMVQNHILQLLCLVAMEPPARLDQTSIREEKIKVLRALRPIAERDVHDKTVRGQYRAGAIDGQPVKHYLDEDRVAPDSTTETFVAIKAEIDNWRWAGVPFYLRTGKRMQQRQSEIVIHFRAVPHRLFADKAGAIQDNRLVIRLQPNESIRLGMMVKVPGIGMKLRAEDLNLNLAETFKQRTPGAYERLLLDVIRGNATLFMHREEVETAWRWIEPILDAWSERGDAPRAYMAGTWGPSESIALVVRDDRAWSEQLT